MQAGGDSGVRVEFMKSSPAVAQAEPVVRPGTKRLVTAAAGTSPGEASGAAVKALKEVGGIDVCSVQ